MIHIPSQEATTARLAELTGYLQSALTHGTTMGRAYLARNGRFDPYVFATLTRYHALAKLNELRLDAKEEDDGADDQPLFISLNRANLGIHVVYDQIMVRVYKSGDGLLPVPASRAKQNFFNQQTEMFVHGADLLATELNLVYLWDCNAETHVFNALRLVCPKTGGKSRDLVQTHWEHDFVIVERLLDSKALETGPDATTGDFEDIAIKRIESDSEIKKTMDQ